MKKLLRSTIYNSAILELGGGLIAAVLFLLVSVSVTKAEYHQTIPTETGVSIEVSSFLSNSPDFGTIPLQVRIGNDTDEVLAWEFSAEVKHYRSADFKTSERLRVPARKTKTFSIIVDVLRGEGRRNYFQSIQYTIRGPGVSGYAKSVSKNIPAIGSFHHGKPEKTYTPFSIYSRDLSPFAEYLNTALKAPEYSYGKKKKEEKKVDTSWLGPSELYVYFGSIAQIELFPSDWRGYLAVRQVWISKNEFSALTAAQQEALLAWVQQGGVLLRTGSEVSFFDREGYIRSANKRHFYKKSGLGVIVEVPFSASDLLIADYNEWLSFTIGQHQPLIAAEEKGNRKNWDLQKLVNRNNVLAGPVAVILILYTILAAPVAILWFAIANKRPASLYLLVPLLSTSASIILILTIIFQYGIGAKGVRQLAVILSPKDRQMIVVQEQSSINGVLLGTSFDLASSVAIRPISMVKNYREKQGQVLQSRSNRYAGDYFRERAQTGQVLQQVRPTRSRIDLIAGSEGPILASSLPVTLSRVYYIDDAGEVWAGSGLSEGSQVALQRGSQLNLVYWMDAVKEVGTKAIEPLASGMQGRRGYFYAVCENANALTIPSLKSVKWKTAPAVIMGPVRRKGENY